MPSAGVEPATHRLSNGGLYQLGYKGSSWEPRVRTWTSGFRDRHAAELHQLPMNAGPADPDAAAYAAPMEARTRPNQRDDSDAHEGADGTNRNG